MLTKLIKNLIQSEETDLPTALKKSYPTISNKDLKNLANKVKDKAVLSGNTKFLNSEFLTEISNNRNYWNYDSNSL